MLVLPSILKVPDFAAVMLSLMITPSHIGNYYRRTGFTRCAAAPRLARPTDGVFVDAPPGPRPMDTGPSNLGRCEGPWRVEAHRESQGHYGCTILRYVV